MSKAWPDPLVEEVRRRGQAYTQRFGNDIHAIMEDLRKHKRENPDHYVSQITVVPGEEDEQP